MEETGERECEESQAKDQGSRRSNEMEGRCERNCRGDEVDLATFGNKKKNELKLDKEEESAARRKE